MRPKPEDSVLRRSNATEKRYAVVFVRGLPNGQPQELEEIWRWALMRDDPKGDVFP